MSCLDHPSTTPASACPSMTLKLSPVEKGCEREQPTTYLAVYANRQLEAWGSSPSTVSSGTTFSPPQLPCCCLVRVPYNLQRSKGSRPAGGRLVGRRALRVVLRMVICCCVFFCRCFCRAMLCCVAVVVCRCRRQMVLCRSWYTGRLLVCLICCIRARTNEPIRAVVPCADGATLFRSAS